MPFDTSLYKKVFQKFTPHLDPFHPVSHYGCDGGEDHGQQHVQDQDANDPPSQVEQATMLDGWRSAALIVAKFVRNCFTTHLVCISAPRRRRWGRQFSPLSQAWMFLPINICGTKKCYLHLWSKKAGEKESTAMAGTRTQKSLFTS